MYLNDVPDKELEEMIKKAQKELYTLEEEKKQREKRAKALRWASLIDALTNFSKSYGTIEIEDPTHIIELLPDSLDYTIPGRIIVN